MDELPTALTIIDHVRDTITDTERFRVHTVNKLSLLDKQMLNTLVKKLYEIENLITKHNGNFTVHTID